MVNVHRYWKHPRRAYHYIKPRVIVNFNRAISNNYDRLWTQRGTRSIRNLGPPNLSRKISRSCMMTSLNENTFRITDHLWGESNGQRMFSSQKPIIPCFFAINLNKLLNKKSSCQWWRSGCVTVMGSLNPAWLIYTLLCWKGHVISSKSPLNKQIIRSARIPLSNKKARRSRMTVNGIS